MKISVPCPQIDGYGWLRRHRIRGGRGGGREMCQGSPHSLRHSNYSHSGETEEGGRHTASTLSHSPALIIAVRQCRKHSPALSYIYIQTLSLRFDVLWRGVAQPELKRKQWTVKGGRGDALIMKVPEFPPNILEHRLLVLSKYAAKFACSCEVVVLGTWKMLTH